MADPVQAFFAALQTQLEKSLPAAQAQALLADIEKTAYLSSNLIDEITAFQTSQNGKLTLGSNATDGSSDPGANPASITLPTITSSFWYSKGADYVQLNFTGSAFTPTTAPIWDQTESANGLDVLASEFIGVLSHELGHVNDTTAAADLTSLNPKIGINEGFAAGILLLSEGKATANAVQVAGDVAANPMNKLAYHSYIPLSGVIDSDGIALLQKYPNPGAVNSVSAYASVYTTENPTYLPLYLSDWSKFYNGINDAALIGSAPDISTKTPITVVEAPDGLSLQSLTFYRTVNATGQVVFTTYDYHTQIRSDRDANSGQLLTPNTPAPMAHRSSRISPMPERADTRSR